VGLRALGDVAALPRGALGDYLGASGPAIEVLARGEDARPLVPARPPLVLTARRDLDFALADRAQLAALLERLVAPLAAELRRQGLGATRATLTLGHAGGRATAFAARLATPVATAPDLLRPLLALLPAGRGGGEGEEGEGDEGDGVTALQVTLTAPRALVARQTSFFDTRQERAERLHAMLAEARGRFGGRLGYLRPVDPRHPLPERRYVLDDRPPPAHGRAGHGGGGRRFSSIRPIEVQAVRRNGFPDRFRWRGRVERVRQVQATWQLAEGWWRGDGQAGQHAQDAATRRRYYRLVTHAGLWCDIYHDLIAERWYLDRVFD
jgi:protein ImuB